MIIVLHTTEGEKFVSTFINSYSETEYFALSDHIYEAETIDGEEFLAEIQEWFDRSFLRLCLTESITETLDIADVKAVEFRETTIVRIDNG